MKEMNKSKDVRSRANRLSRQKIKQSGQKLLSGDLFFGLLIIILINCLVPKEKKLKSLCLLLENKETKPKTKTCRYLFYSYSASVVSYFMLSTTLLAISSSILSLIFYLLVIFF